MLKSHLSVLAPALLLCAVLNAQTVQRQVLANAGSSATIPGYTVSWTLGEDFVDTRQSAAPVVYLTEGFQQPEPGTSPTLDLPEAGTQITVSPNPAHNALNVSVSEPPASPLHMVLLDLQGRILQEAALSDTVATLDLSALPDAVYILSLTDGKGWKRAVQVVKQ